MNLVDDPFVEFLRVRHGCSIYLKPYWGNSGDELIWMGNDVLLRELGLNRILNPQKAAIIMVPGGNATMWDLPLSEWQDCWRRWPNAEFVVAPAGFQGGNLPWRKMLKASDAKIAGLFARDNISYENLCRLGLPPTVKIGLAHDPAFHLRNSRWIIELREACSSEYILASFRGDCESKMHLPNANASLKIWPFTSMLHRYRHRHQANYSQRRLTIVREMAQLSLPLMERDASVMSFQSFVECISRAAQVHTDRLHCMILAVLLGKEVFAYPTAYLKLESVYEHSIKSWAKVNFVEIKEESP